MKPQIEVNKKMKPPRRKYVLEFCQIPINMTLPFLGANKKISWTQKHTLPETNS